MVATVGRRVAFSPFAASVFAPHLFCGDFRARLGCGASALALITGIAPEIISDKNARAHYSDRFMTGFLKVWDYHLLRLTPDLIARAKTKIGQDHVLLISQLLRENEGTWGVIFGDAYYHNFSVYSLSSLSFLNKPILSAYLVVHPSWRLKAKTKRREPKLTPKNQRLALGSLRKHCKFSEIRSWA